MVRDAVPGTALRVEENKELAHGEAGTGKARSGSRRQRATSGGEQVMVSGAVAGIVQRVVEGKDYASGLAGTARPPRTPPGESGVGFATESTREMGGGYGGNEALHNDGCFFINGFGAGAQR